MKNIYIYILSLFLLTSCDTFLGENPDINGNDPIMEVSQLDALFNYVYVSKTTSSGYSSFFACDDSEITPSLYSYNVALGERAALSIWDKTTYTNLYGNLDWSAIWHLMFTFNTVLEYADKVDGDPNLKKQVKAEALFHRAYFHFSGLVQFALHPSIENGKTPGIGYREGTNPKDVLNRETVEYTMNKIIQDLEDAEKILTEIGRTEFIPTRNWRITVPTVHSFRARVELYKAKDIKDYETAANYATKAFEKYNALVNIDTDPLLQTTEINIANKPITWRRLEMSLDNKNVGDYKECYFPHTTLKPSTYTDLCPVSHSLVNSYEKEDLRLQKFINNNYNYSQINNLPYPLVKNGLDTLDGKSYLRYYYGSIAFLCGPTTAEMILIKAEYYARNNQPAQAKQELDKLRSNRFSAANQHIAKSLSGSLKDVKDERRRELPFVLRWYDLKRYNVIKGEEVTITKTSYSNIYDLKSSIKTYTLKPDAGFYAMPIPETELRLLNWEQNKYTGVE